MRVLITNDDGHDAPGIQALADAMAAAHDVAICAPLRQRSATGHAITLSKPMAVRRIPRGYAIDGTPADCVKIALGALFPPNSFDILLSGINDGPNMGDDIFYSGTVAGAREGAMNGLPSMAFSFDEWWAARDFRPAAAIAVRAAEAAARMRLDAEIILNVNIPNRFPVKGVKATHLGKRVYRDIIAVEPGGLDSLGGFATITGERPSHLPIEGTDLVAVSQGYVSITALANECGGRAAWSRVESLASELSDLVQQSA